MISKTLALGIFGALVAAAPITGKASENAWGLAGTYWDTKDGDDTAGATFRLNIQPLEAKHTRVDFRVSYYDNVLPNTAPLSAELAVTPIELGLSLHTSPKGPMNAYIGGGLSFCFMDASSNASNDPFSSGDELGYYGFLGIEGTILERVNSGSRPGQRFSWKAAIAPLTWMPFRQEMRRAAPWMAQRLMRVSCSTGRQKKRTAKRCA